jgi:L-threonylcarbamoyladenylate synthase
MRILPPSPESVAEAAAALRRGELVGMPTETVYGIAALALDPVAVARTFEVKGRPAENPLIVHVASPADVPGVAREFPEEARRLAERFWPGPLTLVLPKRERVPAAVTAGLDTVAVRVPDHPVAQALLAAVGAPVSAPSANVFMGLSPTRPEDIAPEIAKRLAMILDGGPSPVGLESTVVDCTGPIRILRPGGVTRADVEAALGRRLSESAPPTQRRSPGLYARHYAPRTPLRVVERLLPHQPGLTLAAPASSAQRLMPPDPVLYGAQLYATLHALDQEGHAEIFVEAPPEAPEWEAVWDRLRKASGVG